MTAPTPPEPTPAVPPSTTRSLFRTAGISLAVAVRLVAAGALLGEESDLGRFAFILAGFPIFWFILHGGIEAIVWASERWGRVLAPVLKPVGAAAGVWAR